MKLNHLDLQVSDVPRSVLFFETFFGFTLQSNRASPAIAIMSDGDGFVLVLQRKQDPRYPEGFHIGFLVDDVATVVAKHAHFVAHGVEVSAVDRNARGTMIYARTEDGILVEVSCRRKD